MGAGLGLGEGTAILGSEMKFYTSLPFIAHNTNTLGKGQSIEEGGIILILFNCPQDSQQALLSPRVQSDVTEEATCQSTDLTQISIKQGSS